MYRMTTRKPSPDGFGMHGSGLFIVNPPWTLPATLKTVMPWLTRTLAHRRRREVRARIQDSLTTSHRFDIMVLQTTIDTITHAIGLAVAPVFLLTAIATLIGTLNTRLGRIIDRRRVVLARGGKQCEDETMSNATELQLLSQRARLVYLAVLFAVISALMVCLVVSCAFFGVLFTVVLSDCWPASSCSRCCRSSCRSACSCAKFSSRCSPPRTRTAEPNGLSSARPASRR
jgi:hypothetical protein